MKPPEPLAAHHLVDDFSCSRPVLNTWLKTRARFNESYGASRTFVVCADKSHAVIGYYCLSQGAVGHGIVSARLRRNMPDPIPMTLLGRLAVDHRALGRGLGTALLKDAVMRSSMAASIVGSRGLMVHALDEEAAGFYAKFGFAASPAEPLLLVLSFHR